MAYNAFDRSAVDKRRFNKGRSPDDLPRVRISRHGLTLNKVAFACLSNPAKVLLMWDRDLSRIGITAAPIDDNRAYTIRRPNGYNCGQVNCKSMWTRLGISDNVSRVAHLNALNFRLSRSPLCVNIPSIPAALKFTVDYFQKLVIVVIFCEIGLVGPNQKVE
jgi:hypothetical protein